MTALAHEVHTLSGAAVKYGPQAINMTADYLQVHAIFSLIEGFVLVPLGIFIIWKLWEFGWNYIKEDGENWEDYPHIILPIGMVTIAGGVGLIAGAFATIFSISVWIAAIDPHLALVRIALDAAHVSVP